MRLIDADALLKEWRLECGGSCFIRKDKYCMHYDRTKGICTLIIKAPTVEPTKHGRWIDNKVAFHRVCSECGAVIRQDISLVYLLECMDKVGKLNFCPNCGADMREVEE